jgi:hypothetical protein
MSTMDDLKTVQRAIELMREPGIEPRTSQWLTVPVADALADALERERVYREDWPKCDPAALGEEFALAVAIARAYLGEVEP